MGDEQEPQLLVMVRGGWSLSVQALAVLSWLGPPCWGAVLKFR